MSWGICMCQSYGVFWANLGVLLKRNLKEKNHCSISFSLCATEVSCQIRWQKEKERTDIWELIGRPDLSPKVWCISTPRFPVWMFKIAALELTRHNHRIACPCHSQPKKAMVKQTCVVRNAWDCSVCVYFQNAFLKYRAFLGSTPDSFFLVSSTQRNQICPLKQDIHAS